MGDGYFPFVFPGEDIKVMLPHLLNRVRSETAALGRPADAIEFTSGGARTVEEARWYAEIGIDRLTIAVRASTKADMRDELLRFGDEVIASSAEL